MSGREFGMLGASIWQSRRFRRLGSDSARLAFCYVISTGHGNTIGTYRLNPAYMAADRNISNDQAEADLLDLGHVGLIDYDGQEHVIHIRRWFERNKITNRKHLAGALRSLSALLADAPRPRRSLSAGLYRSLYVPELSRRTARESCQRRLRVSFTACWKWR